MRKDKLADVVFLELKDRILLDRLRPGERVCEEQLVEQFHMSRTPIRQALQHLEALGLVEARDGVGTFVTMIDQRDMADAYEIRREVEKIAIRTSIGKITETELDELEGRFLRFKRQLEKGGYGAAFEEITFADWQLHDYIISRSDNRFLSTTVEKITLLLRRYQFAYISGYTRATNEHLEIISGIRKRDVETVQKILDEHLRLRPL